MSMPVREGVVSSTSRTAVPAANDATRGRARASCVWRPRDRRKRDTRPSTQTPISPPLFCAPSSPNSLNRSVPISIALWQTKQRSARAGSPVDQHLDQFAVLDIDPQADVPFQIAGESIGELREAIPVEFVWATTSSARHRGS